MTRSTPSSNSLRADLSLPLAGGQQRGLVDQVGEVGADEPGGHRGDLPEVDLVVERAPSATWTLQDVLAAGDVGPVDDDLAVEPAGPDQRGVERLGPVGRRDQDDPAVRVEPVHLRRAAG